jgi:OmcA/MtrC family decaheme c-type cytochrome
MFKRASWLAAVALAIAAAGCSGSDGAQGPAGAQGPKGDQGQPGNPGAPGVPGIGTSTGLKVSVTSVSTTAGAPITVRFTVKDDKGYPVDLAGNYSTNAVMKPSFGIGYTTTSTVGANTVVDSLNVYTKSGAPPGPTPTMYNPLNAGQGTLVENGSGAGDYTYTFPTTTTTNGAVAVAYDATKLSNTHVVWIQIARQTDTSWTDDPATFTAVNQDYWYVPAGGTATKREIVQTASCSACHRGFKPGEGSVAASFHGAGRVEAPFCNVCHNPGHVPNTYADSKIFVHRIHNAARLQPANVFHGIVATYPQDIRNCDACHKNAAQGAQAYTNPTRAACGSCHDYVSFTGGAAKTCTDPVTVDANGIPVPCNHAGSTQANDASCYLCHNQAGIKSAHLPVLEPDLGNVYVTSTSQGNANTNAAWLAAVNTIPVGAKAIAYEIASVDAVAIGTTGNFNPSIKFRFLVNDVPTAMNSTGDELFDGFVGSPSVYFAFAVPQDGQNAPADFNATGSGYIRNIRNGVGDIKTTGTTTFGSQNAANDCTVAAPCTCTKTSPCYVPNGTISGPETGTNFYTIKLTNTVVPGTAKMLTGGVGYTYGLGAFDTAPQFIGNTQPLTEIDLTDYPYAANGCPTTNPFVPAGASCGGTGGLIVPAADKWQVANGYTGRRQIVDNAKCQTCHVALGAEPTFHAGQRNDGPTCAFCHNTNKTNNGWSLNAPNFIHSIHGARVRSTEFTYGKKTATDGYGDVGFPGPINNCSACHVDGGNDFSALAVTKTSGTTTQGNKGGTVCTVAAPCSCSTNSPCTIQASGASSVPNLLASTVVNGTPTAGFSISPYVSAGTNYGTAFSFTAATGAITQAASTTLVNSPVMAACVGCHDAPVAIDHMQTNGGHFYEARSSALAAGATLEQCLLCHGANNAVAIKAMHQ